MESASSAVASILTKRGRVHDVDPGGTVLSTMPGCVDAKMLWYEVFFHSPQPGDSWSAGWTFSFPVGTK